MLKNNIISSVTGIVHTDPVTVCVPEKCVSFEVSVLRKSGQRDLVNIVTPQLDCSVKKGDSVRISGFLYAYQMPANEYPRFMVCLYSLGVVKTNFPTNKNVIIFKGVIVKKPQFRVTPLGTNICEVLVAVNNDINGLYASYVPCILWNKDAEVVKDYEIGTELYGVGRLQSREYIKQVNGVEKSFLTRELSINSYKVLDKDGN